MARKPSPPSFGDIFADDPPAGNGNKGASPRGRSIKPRRQLAVPMPAFAAIILGVVVLVSAQVSLRFENNAAANNRLLVIPKQDRDLCLKSRNAFRNCYPGNAQAVDAIIGASQLGIKSERLPASYAIPDSLLPPPAGAKGK